MKRPLLLPLVPLYWVGLWVKNALYDLGVLRTKRLARPVISVGSLSTGGAGKTPVVIMLGKLLIKHGIQPDVLSRGYGRLSDEVLEVPVDGSGERFGDEPVEIRRNGIRVFVGADRFGAGKLGEASHGGDVDVHLLDDGFQHRRLARGLDVVLLTREDAADWLLPAGNLREPMASLVRADVVILRDEEAESLRPLVAARSKAEIWIVRRRLVVPDGEPKRLFAFCGIARPEGFAAMLREAGQNVVGTKFFLDHHVYSTEDIDRLVVVAREAGADGFCITQKDFTKISRQMTDRLLKVGPVWPVKLRATLLDEDGAVRRIRAAMRST